MPELTPRQFALSYASNSNMTIEQLARLNLTVAPCQCGDDEYCRGWKMVHDEMLVDFDIEDGRYTREQATPVSDLLTDD